MARLTLSEFLNNRSLLAIKISSHDLGGFFRKSITIPLYTTGLALHHDGSCALMTEGQEVSGRFDLVLAKRGETAVRLVFPDLRTSDGLVLSATAAVTLELATTRLDLFRDFCRAFFNFPGTFAVQDLKNLVAPEVRRLLGAYVVARPASELHRADLLAPLGGDLHGGLERFLFDGGVRAAKVLEVALVSKEFEERTASEKKRVDEQR